MTIAKEGLLGLIRHRRASHAGTNEASPYPKEVSQIIEDSGRDAGVIHKRWKESTNLKPNQLDETFQLIHIQKSLVYFEDAERDPMPRMLKELGWEVVKKYFVDEVKKFVNQ